MPNFSFNWDAKGPFKGSVKKFIKNLDDRVAVAAKHIGRQLAHKTASAVYNKIPNEDGWIKLYRDSIKFVEDDSDKMNPRWKIAGVVEIKLTDVPAETTRCMFNKNSNDPIVALMATYNPWTIDTIPSISGGYNDTLIATPENSEEVSLWREELRDELPTIISKLKDLGATILKNGPQDGKTRFQGRAIADLNYMAKRLEHGFAGFRKVPHWSYAQRQLTKNSEKWAAAKSVKKRVEDAFGDNKLKDSLPKGGKKRFVEGPLDDIE